MSPQIWKPCTATAPFFPFIMAVCGGTLGIIGLYTMPDYPAKDVITAITVGIASGLAATGVNQMYKQYRESTGSCSYIGNGKI
ncbi:phage holin family protein [Dorea formicigenerans]|nr:phage holin family protein [Dorea formicigenerans]